MTRGKKCDGRERSNKADSFVAKKTRTMVLWRALLLWWWPSTALLHFVLVVTTTAAFSTSSTLTTPATRSPVIGILSQPDVDRNDGEAHTPGVFYIAASYVKWLEAGGARSIPIPYDATNELFDKLFAEIDGLLLPGGSATFPPFLQYALDTIVAANQDGTRYFPVWGTCLGYEFLIQYGGGMLQANYDAYNISLPLENVSSSSSLYADPAVYETVRKYPITMNNHHQGITPQDFADHPRLSSWWNVTSINHDRNGQPFVSTIEPIAPETLPIYGVQYHPEKNAFEYATYPGDGDIPYETIDHSERGVNFSLYTARFFVNLARRSMQMGRHHTGQFPYVQQYPSVPGLKFELKYLIPPSSSLSSTSLHSSQPQQQPLFSSWRQKSSSHDHSSLRGGGADPTTITTTSSSSVLPF
jgi:gamma-glutamyl hydrolase